MLLDGPPPNTIEPIPGLIFSDLWETVTPPNDVNGTTDTVTRPVRLEPRRFGTILKVVTFPPISQYKEDDWKGVYETIGASAQTNDGGSMHRTMTIDYVVVLKGEMHCVLEEGVVVLRAGDVLIQRGTNHAWENRGSEPCTILGVMVSNEA
ncbi:MAG TPA: cupin domain-containing protein [Steroidobacteraceae bacterium]|nr:cupin domain-containing protein [Steroidobacteraceae bacterium]